MLCSYYTQNGANITGFAIRVANYFFMNQFMQANSEDLLRNLLVLTLFIILSFVLLGDAFANENTTNNEESTPYEFCGQLGAIDDSYCYLNYGVDITANSLNRWFTHEGGNNSTPATTKGRLRLGWEPRSGDFSEVDFRFKIRVKLPALEDRVELFFSDAEDDTNQQVVKAARNNELGNQDQAVLALQFKKDAADKVSYRIGFGRGSQLYTRMRYSDKNVLSPQATLHYFAEANYYSGDKLGFEVNADYSYLVSDTSAFEISNSFKFRDKSDDWIWHHEIQYLHVGKNDTSYMFTASMEGVSQPSYRKEQMLTSIRYKRKVLRDWLYIEVEPFILWLRSEEFRASVGLAIRTEIHFST